MESIQNLLNIMAKLRSPEGCPWDREQTHHTLRTSLIEECYELIEAIESEQDSALQEELGDLLLHVVFHAQMAQERKAFDFSDLVTQLNEKLIRRHPHVFANASASDSAQVLQQWDAIKKEEKPERQSALDGVPQHLPALMLAQKIQKKASKVGFDWSDITPVFEKVREELRELESATQDNLNIEEELGDLLFSIVNLARHVNVDAEQACRLAVKKFQRRFQKVEALSQAQGKELNTLSLEQMDELWEQVKDEDRSAV